MPPAILLAVLLATETLPLARSEQELNFGIEAAQKGLWTEAHFRFERATVLDPQSAKAQNDLAVSLEQQGDFVKAREAYEKAMKLKPGDEQIQQNYDLFREADDKRNRKAKSKAQAPGSPAPTPTAAKP
jgi:Flp pilus assembly protein TadD